MVLIGVVYWGVRPQFVERIGPQAYIAGLIVLSFVIGSATAWWQARRHHYACGNCGHTFDVTLARHLIGQNWFGGVRTRCPSGEQKHWCSPVPK